ncbi:Uncharacterised protein [Vibrio cholerae]|nr:Uncharacterised protein [Vibrio cholerae]CSH92088.1 Uncharacterised protein [Vibrio cholerae]
MTAAGKLGIVLMLLQMQNICLDVMQQRVALNLNKQL